MAHAPFIVNILTMNGTRAIHLNHDSMNGVRAIYCKVYTEHSPQALICGQFPDLCCLQSGATLIHFNFD